MLKGQEANVLVFGGRDLCYDSNEKTYDVEEILQCYKILNIAVKELGKTHVINVVDGVAKGADTVGYRWGQSNGFKPMRFEAVWYDGAGFNRLAGFERNTEMLKVATHCVGFWDGVSNGTNDTRKKCIKQGLPLRMFKYSYVEGVFTIERMEEWEK